MRKTRSGTVQRSPSRARRITSDAVEIIDSLLIGNDQEMRRHVAEATVNGIVAQLIWTARNQAGLTQAQLARLVSTTQPVISQLEDARYTGHSLSMLRRIAEALGKRLDIRFIDVKKRKSA